MLIANEELNETTTFAPALLYPLPGYCNDPYRQDLRNWHKQ
ncbi:hypothetical protein [Nostoc sphaeroides]|uniref:Uncharacterized protein n=1 Tax=Nostoc sphaeroides CCNUC1 TaxID=2653204 RepID=A0A5P8WD39_9NOSO|nr:hypothetical protein [Nostoc sphaeroides]QFS50472.1 hypothetical protein GXM_07966 [Nostoc sphaeroides CCNUC1]